MKKLLVCFMLFSINFVGYTVDLQPVQAEEAYAKWGRIAMSKAEEKYPKAKIKDYKHIGRLHGTNTTIEKFKLWLKENDKEFGVLVYIEFDKKTEKVIDITLKEVEK